MPVALALFWHDASFGRHCGTRTMTLSSSSWYLPFRKSMSNTPSSSSLRPSSPMLMQPGSPYGFPLSRHHPLSSFYPHGSFRALFCFPSLVPRQPYGSDRRFLVRYCPFRLRPALREQRIYISWSGSDLPSAGLDAPGPRLKAIAEGEHLDPGVGEF